MDASKSLVSFTVLLIGFFMTMILGVIKRPLHSIRDELRSNLFGEFSNKESLECFWCLVVAFSILFSNKGILSLGIL